MSVLHKVETPKDRRSLYVILGVGIVLAIVVVAYFFVIGPAGNSFARATATGALPAQDRAQLTSMVKAYGGEANAAVSYAHGQRNAALSALSIGQVDEQAGSTEVYVAVVNGDFVMSNARVPQGAALPTGHYLVATFSLDGALAPLDVGVTDVAPDLVRVGVVTTEPLN